MQIKCHKMIDQKYIACDQGVSLLYALPGEVISYQKQTKVNVSDVLEKSPHRTRVICPIFERCGGCDYLHIDYNHQVTLKNAYVSEQFDEFDIKDKMIDLKPSEVPFNYRHKVVLSATIHKKRLKLGLYKDGSKDIEPYLDCHIQDQSLNEIMKTIENELNRYKLTPYDIDTNQGIIKHVFLRKGYQSKEVLVCFVTQGHLFPNHKPIIRALLEKHSEVKTVLQNIHRKKTHLVLLDEEKIFYGPGYIYDYIGALKFRLSLKSFYQINPKQMMVLYQSAIDIAHIKPHETVMDCYSGIGTLSLLLSQKAKKVVAVEINQKAHKDALFNMKINQINNVTFINQDVEETIKTYQEKIDCLVLDPTRDGASKAFIDAVLIKKPKRILYISCDPSTQTRDVKQLLRAYDIKTLMPVDMFSQTIHVENIILLSLRTS